MFEITSILDFLIGSLILIREISIIKSTHSFSIKNACNLGFSLYLFLIPGIFFMYCPLDRAQTMMLYDRNGAIKSVVFSFICYLAFNFGYQLIKRKYKRPVYTRKTNEIKLSFILLIVSAVCFFLWARSFGGLSALLANAGAIRSGWIKPDVQTAFFKHPVQLAKLSSLYIFVILLIRQNKFKSFGKKVTLYILEVVSLGISILYIMADDSRSAMGLYFMSFVVAYLFKKVVIDRQSIGKTTIKAVVFISVILFAILNGDVILGTMRGTIQDASEADTTENGIIGSIIHNFAYLTQSPFYAMYYVDEMDGRLLIWDDLITGLTAWLPSSLKPFPDALRTWDVNTTIHCLHTHLFGQFPHSIVANSIYDLSYFGLFIIPCILGLIVKKVENVMIPNLYNPFYLCIYCLLFFSFSNMIQGFCLYYTMLGLFYLIVGLVIFLCISKKVRIRNIANVVDK